MSNEDKFVILGNADLLYSNNYIKDGSDFSDQNPVYHNWFFGIWEYTSAAISNGISYDGNFLPVFAIFLAFSDYMRGSILKRFLSTSVSPFSSSNNFLMYWFLN